MNKKISTNHILYFLLLVAVFALVFVYILQYFYHLQPCHLCLWQRKPFFAIIIISAIALFLKQQNLKKIAAIFSILLLLTNAAIALYHSGVERKIFKINEGCTSTISNDISSIEELKEMLAKAPAVRCDEPSFIFLKLSIANCNALYCLVALALAMFLYRKS